MTDTTLPPGDDSVDRIQPVDIQQEMQRSYIDYAMSVIVGRALPEVRDGLKPVHRRVLYAMYDSGFRPDRSHAKSARSVAETMGNYHPHGDASIYDTLVRMAQPWSLRYPLVDGQGNFGSPGNDPPAAMRYCVTADALVRLPFGQSVRIGDVVPGAKPNTDNVTDLKVLDRHGNPVLADRLFHSGDHQTYTVRTAEGYEVTGTANHPLLCLVDVGGVPTLLWRLIEEIRPDDCVVMQRTPPTELGPADWEPTMEALLLGAFISEGFVSEARAGFNNLDRDFFNTVVTAYDAVVGGTRYVSERTIASGSLLYELDIHNVNALRVAVFGMSSDSVQPTRLYRNGFGRRRPASSAHSCRRCSKATGRAPSCPATRFRSRTRRAASGWRKTSSRCCSSSASFRAATGTPSGSTRSSSPTVHRPNCSPRKSVSAVRNKRS